MNVNQGRETMGGHNIILLSIFENGHHERKETYGFRSTKPAPRLAELKAFEKDLLLA